MKWMLLLIFLICGENSWGMAHLFSIPIQGNKGKLVGEVLVEPQQIKAGEFFKVIYRRPSWKEKDVAIHYGFNGWKLKSQKRSSLGYLSNSYYDRRPMKWNPQRSQFEVTLKAPEKAKALHMVFCVHQCQEWDNNLKEDYSWPVEFPYWGPILTWNQRTRPDTGIVVSFENSFPSPAWIEYWPVHKPQKKIKAFSSSGHLHRFELNGLLPETTYHYRVGIDRFHSSSLHQFRTAQRESEIKSLTFIVFGDAQDDGLNGKFNLVTREILDHHQEVDFLVSTGDLAYNDRPGDWWTFFDKARELLASKVLMPAIGNHDTPTPGSHQDVERFKRYFHLPDLDEQQTFYEFRYGPARFLALNSERPKEWRQEDGRQFAWVARQLKKNGAPWNFSYWHIPPFNLGQRHWMQQGQVRDVLTHFGGIVDWQFSGHEHSYQRTRPLTANDDHGWSRPLAANEYGTEGGKGMGFLVVPAAGIRSDGYMVPPDHPNFRQRHLFAFPEFVFAELDELLGLGRPQIGFVKVRLDGNRFQLSTWSRSFFDEEVAPFRVIDAVAYEK